MIRRVRVFISSVVVAGLAISACGTPAAAPSAGADIALGLSTPLSAPGAVTAGQQIERGAQLGIEYVNTVMKGVLGGRKLVLHVEDDQGQNEKGVAAYRRLVTEKNVVAVIGYVHSSELLAVQQVAKGLGVPTMSAMASNKDVTAGHLDIAFRTHVIDPVRAAAWLQLIKEKGWKKIAMIAEDTDYGVGLVDETKNQAKDLGLNLDLQVNVVDKTAVDMTPQLLKMKDFKPDLVIVAASDTQVDLIIDQASQIGLHPAVPMLNSEESLTAPKFWQLHPKNGKGMMTVIEGLVPGQQLSEPAKWMAKKYQEKYNEEAIYPSLDGFGQVIVIAQALDLAKSTDPKALITALETGTFTGWADTAVTMPKADGVHWHNWSPPVAIIQFTEEGQDWHKSPILIKYTGK